MINNIYYDPNGTVTTYIRISGHLQRLINALKKLLLIVREQVQQPTKVLLYFRGRQPPHEAQTCRHVIRHRYAWKMIGLQLEKAQLQMASHEALHYSYQDRASAARTAKLGHQAIDTLSYCLPEAKMEKKLVDS